MTHKLFSIPRKTFGRLSGIFGGLLLAATVSEAAPAVQVEDLRGPITRTELTAKNYPWLVAGLASGAKKMQTVSAPELRRLATGLAEVSIEVFFGSWCSDSHDHLPQFLALLDAVEKHSGLTPISLELVALDRKKTYPGYENPRAIERLPTFVFLKDGREIGRITEIPKVSILVDTTQILSHR